MRIGINALQFLAEQRPDAIRHAGVLDVLLALRPLVIGRPRQADKIQYTPMGKHDRFTPDLGDT